MERILCWAAAAVLVLTACRGLHSPPVASRDSHCYFRALSFAYHPGSEGRSYRAQAGPWIVELDNPDREDNPQVWQGPLRIAPPEDERRTCLFEATFVTAVYYADRGQRLLVQSQRGAHIFLDLVEARRCQAKDGLSALTRGVEVEGNRLRLRPFCDCEEGAERRCICEAGRVYQFDDDCDAQLLPRQSDQLTGEELGVEFSGRREVFAPGTPQARLGG